MLIFTNINIPDMGYDLMHAEFFLYLMVIIFNADMCSSVYVDNRKKSFNSQ